MSIARAFTKRTRRSETPTLSTIPVRTGTVKNLIGKEVTCRMISAPTFVSTTNTLALNAPDVESIRALRSKASSISSSSSTSSAGDSDKSSITRRSRDTQLTDASSVENSPTASPGPHNGDAYFEPKTRPLTQPPRRSAFSADVRLQAGPTEACPQIPQRAPSHSKKAHQILARKLSLRHISSHSTIPSTASTSGDRKETRVSLDMFSPSIEPPSEHPFGKELEQLEEVAEEFRGPAEDPDCGADAKIMKRRNLARFCADDYIADLKPLYLTCFNRPMMPTTPVVGVENGGGWI